MWFRAYSGGFTNAKLVEDKDIYDGSGDFGELSAYKARFTTEDECRAYCDWLNSKAGK